ncbi:BirA family transcriptional regulator, biotin operon repressor / biotin-[acetyl-CoA-carboxylase] ligase [Psychroflexus salarius]|uniref:BirA family transcriptional regulator, biotin operon repressor / biotin-[acetyl-CoA-carboxylase] ligase n=1 Tax=Psychroflexus salarius TaxID=1155689 RepID=A0A1M4T3V4_9FLAO|nr:biotin--[acetyl-CoA-carboxylase] ligase [Psychroflexus salarius]SHE39149.1 BirA family transcriptional regulator, biotin operon repressor / biotin-[acetyl-CoA-carboxylase] ligase [Psychroflexus salarius]
MKIIKINATSSTNEFMRQFTLQTELNEVYCVKANTQTNGRGQMGTSWQSESGKNLIVSYLLPNLKICPDHNFIISMLSSLAIIKTLKHFNLPHLKIKWPNDILSGRKKICGILIENNFKQNHINSTIIGVGLNVNQIDFSELPKASSLQLILGQKISIDTVFRSLNLEIEKVYQSLLHQEFEGVKQDYYAKLLGFNKVQSFHFPDQSIAVGIIKSVSDHGFLKVEFENETSEFELKQIKQLY